MRSIPGDEATLRKFGDKLAGVDYIDRRGAYAVMENTNKEIAVIETSHGYFLPGGGIDPGETDVEALKRELIEEIGYQMSVVAAIGTAVEYMEAAREETYYRIQSTFYKVQLEAKIGEAMERDHRLVWLPQEEAVKRLKRQSQGWAVRSMAGT
jgi:8-oxo-dGTP diphosphatase